MPSTGLDGDRFDARLIFEGGESEMEFFAKTNRAALTRANKFVDRANEYERERRSTRVLKLLRLYEVKITKRTVKKVVTKEKLTRVSITNAKKGS